MFLKLNNVAIFCCIFVVDVVSAALDEVQASVFSALADEKPELYRQVVQFLDKKRKEGL